MEKSYQISKEGIFKSHKYLREHFYFLPVAMILAIPFSHYVKDKTWEFSYTYGPPIAVGAFIALGVIPTLIMHLIHWKKSQGFSVSIDSKNRNIRFNLNEKDSFTFSFDELTVVEHLTLYQQDKRRLSTGWSNYSYLQVKTPDNKEFQISSLILTQEEFPIEAVTTKYTFWPSISNLYQDHQPEIERMEQLRKEKLNFWKNKFSDLSPEELHSRLERPKDYAELPRTAMEQLLNEKSH
ncbi:hypothetical protein [Echinicola sediminis]